MSNHPLIRQLVDALQGALVYDIWQYHSTEWIVRARKVQHDAQLYLGERAAQEQEQPTNETALREAVAESISSLYGCERTWRAWSVGTMTENDFYGAGESDECIDQVMDAVRPFIEARAAQPQAAIDAASDDNHCLTMTCLVEDYMAAVDWHGSQNGEKCDAAIEAIGQYLRKIATPPAPTAKPLTDADIDTVCKGLFLSDYLGERGGAGCQAYDRAIARAIERRLAGDTPAGGA